MDKFVSCEEARKILGVCQKTLRRWEMNGFIDTISDPSKNKRYNVEKYLRGKNLTLPEQDKLKIVYVRVSSQGQHEDLDRQEAFMKEKYPDHLIIKDIGSGINFNRRGFRKIIDLAIENKIDEVIVAHKDRFTRFGFEFFEDLIEKYSGGKIIVLNRKKNIEPQEELVIDMASIMAGFTAKMHGLRRYKT